MTFNWNDSKYKTVPKKTTDIPPLITELTNFNKDGSSTTTPFVAPPEWTAENEHEVHRICDKEELPLA